MNGFSLHIEPPSYTDARYTHLSFVPVMDSRVHTFLFNLFVNKYWQIELRKESHTILLNPGTSKTIIKYK